MLLVVKRRTGVFRVLDLHVLLSSQQFADSQSRFTRLVTQTQRTWLRALGQIILRTLSQSEDFNPLDVHNNAISHLHIVHNYLHQS